jgi:hypothetical protein
MIRRQEIHGELILPVPDKYVCRFIKQKELNIKMHRAKVLVFCCVVCGRKTFISLSDEQKSRAFYNTLLTTVFDRRDVTKR